MELNINQLFKQAALAHQEGKLEDAEYLYRHILKINPTHTESNNNLGVLLQTEGSLNESELYITKCINLKPNFADAHYNLGVTKINLNKLEEAEICIKQSIKLKPNYFKAYNSLCIVLRKLGKLDEAEISIRKAIKLKPDFVDAYNSLGHLLLRMNKPDEAEISYKKAIEIQPEFNSQSYNNLNILLKQKTLVKKIETLKKLKDYNQLRTNDSDKKLISNLFITNRTVENELIKDLYKVNVKDVDKLYKDPRYGNGRCTDFDLFQNDLSNIKIVAEDLINIMKRAVNSDIFIMESFLNIYKDGSGSTPHVHISTFDKNNALITKKFSLVYYLSIGDQNCSEPGILKLYNPHKEILPTEGMVVIFPSHQRHSAVYNGKLDRVMIGVNFYSLL